MKKRWTAAAVIWICGTAVLTGCGPQEALDKLIGVSDPVISSSSVEIVDDADALVVDENIEKPTFTKNPKASVQYEVNCHAAPLTVEATVSDGGSVSYQWYKNNVNSNGGGTAIEGATESSYIPEIADTGKIYYYAVAVNTNGKSVSMATSTTSEVEVIPEGTWIQDDTGWWYQIYDGSYPTSCWRLIADKWYAFDERGYMRTGWFQEGEAWYYLNGDGSMAADTVIDGYTIDENGRWQQDIPKIE